MTRPSILFIGGSGRSGSTMLDILLNQHPAVSAVGEVHRLANYYLQGEECTCGEKVSECPYWTQVIGGLVGANEDAHADAPVSRDQFMLSDAGYGFRARLAERLALILQTPERFRTRAARDFSRNVDEIDRSLALYDSVSLVDKTSVVIDATKDARRMKYLYMYLGERFKLIYLVRDGRGVAASAMRRESIPMRKAAARWALVHTKYRLALRNVPPAQILVVRYEDLCTDTEGTLARIGGFLGIEHRPGLTEIRKDVSHTIGGNPMRFRSAETSIVLDEKWKEGMSKLDLWTFNLIAGLHNRRFGYAWRPRGDG